MNAKKPVLVTTDGSAHSHRVLPHAALLAAALGSRLGLLSVLERSQTDGRAVDELRATLERLGLDGDVLAEARQEGEGTAATILRVALRMDAACLALDSRGYGAVRHVLHGSVALDLLQGAGLPLLVSGPNLEHEAPDAEPYRIVAANDGSPASEAVLRALSPLLEPGRFVVTLLRVHEHEPGGRDDVAALAACHQELTRARGLLPAAVDVETLVREIPLGAGVDTAIIEKALELKAHAIALSTHGLSASRHVLMGSVAITMLGRSPLPLLLARSDV
jgi:nucleotide-binding universal stress UspA family protein